MVVTGPPSFSGGEHIDREVGEGPSTCSFPGMHIKDTKHRRRKLWRCIFAPLSSVPSGTPAATVIPYRSATTALLSHTHPIDPSPAMSCPCTALITRRLE